MCAIISVAAHESPEPAVGCATHPRRTFAAGDRSRAIYRCQVYAASRATTDPECHPVLREISKIHIFEEARHRAYAHQYLMQNWRHVGKFRQSLARRYGLLSTQIIIWQLIHPDIYKNLGLPTEALQMAQANPHRTKIRREISADLVAFLIETDILNEKVATKWRAAGLMA
jgi:hypothetical protein